MVQTMRCPICNGSGELPEPNSRIKDDKAERREAAKVLRDAGYSIRQIAGFLGYKSPRSVFLAIQEKKK